MVVPQAARIVAAVVGVLLVATAASSVIGTLIVPRSVASWLTRKVDMVVNAGFVLATSRIDEYARRDRILSAHAATLLLVQLVAWLAMFFVGFSLIFWPLVHAGITQAFATAGPALWEIGSDRAHSGLEQAVLDVASLAGIITVTLQIAYLPTLYSEFNRRETAITLLNARGGVPSWGPELLARTHYALGSGVSTIDTLPDLYAEWEAWAADVAESHTTYLPLVRFRSPRPKSSWVTSLLAVLDSAALMLSLSPQEAPVVSARLCIRAGFICFNEIAKAMGFAIPDEPDVSRGISLTYGDFLDAVARMRQVDFPIERERELEEAWLAFVGWRVNYEQAAYAIAKAVDAVPALWSGPRRNAATRPMPPIRPPLGRPPDGAKRDSTKAQSAKAQSAKPPSARPHGAGPHGARGQP